MVFSGLGQFLTLLCIVLLDNIPRTTSDTLKFTLNIKEPHIPKYPQFPPGFKFGAASSAYQIEGGWNAVDKSESIWDHFVHNTPSLIANESTGDVACDSYNLWQRDVQIAKELGLHFYRFSISWTRLIPNVETFEVSKAGWLYYDNLINALLKNGIEPMVTLYHWDLPQALQEDGGWLNSSVVDHFAEYARMAFILYGDRVKTWITLNEPITFCFAGYNMGILAPGLKETHGEYICAKNALIAHAKAYRIYDREFRFKFGGKVSIANNNIWYLPKVKGDDEIANLARQHMTGMYAHPIYSQEGGWPSELVKALSEKYSELPLPEFTKQEIKMVKGTYDFYALNYYTARTVRRAKPGEIVRNSPASGNPFLGLVYEIDRSWKKSFADWIALYPAGLRNQMKWIKAQYGDIEIVITEHGLATDRGLNDSARIDAIRTHLNEMQKAIKENKIKLTGYTYWSIMDNMEWHMGYGQRFGLVEVDFTDQNRTRTIRKSGNYYKELISRNQQSKLEGKTNIVAAS